MYLTMSIEWASNRLFTILADQKQLLCDSCSVSERTAYFDPCRALQEKSSKIQETYQSINKSRTQTLQVTWWPGPCKQIEALIGVWKGISCKNNIKAMMFINHPNSACCNIVVFFRKGSHSLSKSVIFPDILIWLNFPILHLHAKINACQRKIHRSVRLGGVSGDHLIQHSALKRAKSIWTSSLTLLSSSL